MVTDPELLTTAQVLELLQIGRTKLWELVRDSALPAYRIGGSPNGRLRFRRSEIMHWLECQRVRPVHPRNAPRPVAVPAQER